MEKIYDPNKSAYTQSINFTEYFQEYRNELSTLSKEDNVEAIMNELTNNEIAPAQMQELDKLINCNILINKASPKKKVRKSTKKSNSATEPGSSQKDDKFLASNFIKISHTPSSKVEVVEEDGTEFLVVVRIFFQHAFSFSSRSINRLADLKPSHEVVLLGSNTLTDLRDKILCTNDIGYSINVESAFYSELKPKEMYPSGFIFIDNVFYNDFRNSKSIDYSGVVIKWAKDQGIGNFSSCLMEETKIKDLSPRLGYPYVYQHQGKCEHILIFTDTRLTTKTDLHLKYPYYSGLCTPNGRYCDMCKKNISNYLCLQSTRLPHDQTYLCENCYYAYNYIQNEKFGDFEAYRYYDKTCIM